MASEASQAKQVAKSSSGGGTARDQYAIASADRFQVKMTFRHWVIAFSISILVIAIFVKCAFLIRDPWCFQAIVLSALATIAACTSDRGTRSAMLFCLSLQLFNSIIVLLPVSSFADLKEHCLIYVSATVLWTAFISFILSINKKVNTHVSKLLPQQQEQTVEIDCGAPGNGFIMNWIVWPLSLLNLYVTLASPFDSHGLLVEIYSIQDHFTPRFIHLVIPTIAAAFWIRRQFANHRVIRSSSSRICFDKAYKSQLKGDLQRPWSALHSVEFSGILNNRELAEMDRLVGCSLTLSFEPEGSVVLDLSKMQRSEIIKLLMQIESHCDHSVFSKSAFVFNQILLGAASIELGSEEQLMTDKLEMQFSATHFVPLVTGTKLLGARYTILTQIASGGMSAVYAAQMSSGDEKKSRHTNVVLKECVLPLNTDQKTRNKAKELFAREATTLAKLDHPQIVRVLDSFVQNEREYIVLEYKSGPTLRQVRQRTQQNGVERIPEWAHQISQILCYLHSLQPPLIHRDLTPDNLILADDNKIFAIDFGVSNEFISNATGTLVGKQAYIPPEQFKGKAEPKSDIYAFGATLYYLYTGKDPIPLSVSNPASICETKQVPDAMVNLIVAATQLEPNKRPSASELEIQLSAIVAGEVKAN